MCVPKRERGKGPEALRSDSFRPRYLALRVRTRAMGRTQSRTCSSNGFTNVHVGDIIFSHGSNRIRMSKSKEGHHDVVSQSHPMFPIVLVYPESSPFKLGKTYSSRIQVPRKNTRTRDCRMWRKWYSHDVDHEPSTYSTAVKVMEHHLPIYLDKTRSSFRRQNVVC